MGLDDFDEDASVIQNEAGVFKSNKGIKLDGYTPVVAADNERFLDDEFKSNSNADLI